MVSLAAQSLAYSLLYNWVDITNGPFGLTGIPRPYIFSYKFETIGVIALLSTLVGGSCLMGMVFVLRSPWGRLLKAMRDDELAARSLGKNTRLVKAGLRGTMYRFSERSR